MEKDKNIKSELEELAPFLSTLEKKEGYQVPFNFFDKLEESVMQEVTPKPHSTLEPASKSWSIREWFSARPAFRYGLAFASIALLIAFIWPSSHVSNSASDNFASIWEEVNLNEVEDYLATNIDDFDLELIEHQSDREPNALEGLDLELEDIDKYIDEHIIEYLDENTLEELL